MSEKKVNILWFRRDLRLSDHTALYHALNTEGVIKPIFIFDEDITDELKKDDSRISFIYQALTKIHQELQQFGSGLTIYQGKVDDIFDQILADSRTSSLFYNEDYEPYALQRDKKIRQKFSEKQLTVRSYKDQVIYAKDDILKDNGTPYTVYSPYKRKWRTNFMKSKFPAHKIQLAKEKLFSVKNQHFPKLNTLGFQPAKINVLPYGLSKDLIRQYKDQRNFPAEQGTSLLSPHLRFGTIGIRELIEQIIDLDEVDSTFLNELIWREFFMQILYHFPKSQNHCFKEKYEHIQWRNDKSEFAAWCNGKTGYLLVDAGMEELNRTGYMHNRVRMVVASFLCKHLLIDWRWGEAYFAEKLLDYECSSNVGNWQWAAGCGCDAAPYFRIFNPHTQLEKFDGDLFYVKKWLGDIEMRSFEVPEIVPHKFARNRALETYKQGLQVRS